MLSDASMSTHSWMDATRIHIICCRWIKPKFPATGSGYRGAQVLNRKQSPWFGVVSSFHCLQADKIAPIIGHARSLICNARALKSVCEDVSSLYKQGKLEKALEVLQLPNKEYMSAVSAAYVQLLHQCIVTQSLPDGRRIHARIVDSGLESNVHVGNTLLRMYLKCGSLENARGFFDRMLMRDVISWNLIMQGYAKSGCGEEALRLWKLMIQEGLKPSRVTFLVALNSCAMLSALEQGKQVHADVVDAGLESDVFVGSSLVDMYGKCGSLLDACHVFGRMPEKNVVSWTAMIAGYARHGRCEEALAMFKRMKQEGLKPNRVTFAVVLNACARIGALTHGRKVHRETVEAGLDRELTVGNALVDMYAKCDSLVDARRVFDGMRKRDSISWNSLISGYGKQSNSEEALQLSCQMKQQGFKFTGVTFVCILNACANLALFELGKRIHSDIIKAGLESNIFVGAALIDMYAKGGSLVHAREVFERMPKGDVVSWTAMIAGYAMHGNRLECFELFRQMQEEGLKPNEVTFVSIFSICSHLGLVDEGYRYYELMTQRHSLTPTKTHCVCMVDLLGRSGKFSEAVAFIRQMRVAPDASVWMALLGACKIYGNVELAESITMRILELEPQLPAAYVLLSNVYAVTGKWSLNLFLRETMEERGVKKEAGCCWIEVNNTLHAFVVDDRSHPWSEEIYKELERLSKQIKEAGYVPDTRFALHNVEWQQQEQILSHHSEKLAIVFGLISTPPGTPIRIVKNVRMCGDCHSATKFISKICERQIIARDAHRFHHFQDGLCSCQDYW